MQLRNFGINNAAYTADEEKRAWVSQFTSCLSSLQTILQAVPQNTDFMKSFYYLKIFDTSPLIIG